MNDRITPHSVANTIRLIRTQQRRCVVIAEGDTDARVLRRVIDPARCGIEVAHGKENALGALEILRRGNVDGVLSVVDKDWDLGPSSDPDVLVTDSHDLETMMYQTPALEKVLGEFASEEKIRKHVEGRGKDLRAILTETALPIGWLRSASARHGLNLKFEGCEYGHFVDKDTLTVDTVGLITEIANKTHDHRIEKHALVEMISSEAQRARDEWDVCCGHDLSGVLALGLRKALGSCNAQTVNQSALERGLRLAYEVSYFRLTQLFRSMRDWEGRNAPYVILN